MRNGSRLHRLWLWSLEAGIEISFFGRDAKPAREISLEIPRQIWRPLCWLAGAHDEHYGECIYCSKPFTESPYWRRAQARNRKERS
jgi:hypothetical protein